MRQLDFVRTENGTIGIITEMSASGSASVEFLRGQKQYGEKTAWWIESELTVIDSLPWLLSRELSHPFGNGKEQAETIFGIKA
jgi:hypothetical protein